MSREYTRGEIIRLIRDCKANPMGRIVPPGGHLGFDDRPAAIWIRWFRERITATITGKMPPRGAGGKARRRAERIADAKADCRWCGTLTGSRNKRYCDVGCYRAFNNL